VAVDKNGDNPEEAVVFDLSGGEAAGVAQFAAAIVSRREMPIHQGLRTNSGSLAILAAIRRATGREGLR